MSYVTENLLPNERVHFAARVHPAIFVPVFISGAACFLFLVVGLFQLRGPDGISGFFTLLICALFFFVTLRLGVEAAVIFTTTEFAVTNRRVIAKTGLLRTRTLEMLLSKIESIKVSQNVVGRLLGFGVVTVVGTGGTHERFAAIASPFAVRMRINQIIEAETQPPAPPRAARLVADHADAQPHTW